MGMKDNLPMLTIGCVVVLGWCALPAFATYVEPPPPPPPVVEVPPKGETPERSDPVPVQSLPLPCCERDGVVEFKAPWPSDRSKAKTRKVCEMALQEGVTFRACTGAKP